MIFWFTYRCLDNDEFMTYEDEKEILDEDTRARLGDDESASGESDKRRESSQNEKKLLTQLLMLMRSILT